MRVDFVKVQGSFWFCQSLEGFHKIGVSRVRIDLVKVLGLFCKINIHKVRVLFCKLLSMDYGLISPKFVEVL